MMLLRELVRRHVNSDQPLALVADPALFPDLERVCRWTVASSWDEDATPGAILVDLASPADPAAELQRWRERWPDLDTWVLVHTTPAPELPVATVVGAARHAGLHVVEAVPLPSRFKVGIVASTRPVAPLGYLNGASTAGEGAGVAEHGPDEAAATRLAWEWALGTLVSRAREVVAEQALARLAEERDAVAQELATLQAASREEAAALRRQAEAAAAREARVRDSASFVLGQHLVSLPRHPASAVRGLVRDSRRLRRQRGES